MNRLSGRLPLCLLLYGLSLPSLSADTLSFATGRTFNGTIIQTNGGDILFLMDYGTARFPLADIKSIRIEPGETPPPGLTNRLPAFKTVLTALAREPWASGLKQIPATVLDTGMLRNVPYVSFRAGNDYEVNIYGDMQHPAGIEAGVLRQLVADDAARSNCVSFVAGLLNQQPDKAMVRGLASTGALQRLAGLTFEVTPPSARDAYEGWWLSAYSENDLALARASEEELKQISVAKADVASQGTNSLDPSAWSTNDLNLARAEPVRLSFTTKSGLSLTNVEVRPYVEGVSLIWRDEGASGGLVKLADCPEDLQVMFHYDPDKAAAADAADRQRAAQEAQALASQAALAAASTPAATPAPAGLHAARSGPAPRAHPRVWVNGYYKRRGVYVPGHWRTL